MSTSSQSTFSEREEAQLNIFSLPPSEPNQFVSASSVKNTFNIASQRKSRSHRLAHTTWNGRYPDGHEFTWKEPALAESHPPVYKHIKSWGLDPNNSTSTANRVEEWKRDFNRDLDGRHKANQSPTEAKCESVFRTWASIHASNRYDSTLPYTPIEGLHDWEMKSALRGDWKGLDHMLLGEPESGEPESFTPDPDCKLQWKLAVKVFRLKAAHDKARELADFELNLCNGQAVYTHLVDQNLATIQRDEKKRGKQRRTAPKSKAARPSRASKPQEKPSSEEETHESLKRKRDDSEATTVASSSSSTPPADAACEQAPAPQLRRATRQKKPRVHLDGLSIPAYGPPITTGETPSSKPFRVTIIGPRPPPPPPSPSTSPPPPPRKILTLRLPPNVLARFDA